jgi:general secretion pathway protein G
MGATPMTGNKGFTLFEMLIVVAIIGVIALAAVPVAEISYVKTQETELQNNLESIRQAIRTWKNDCRRFVTNQTSSKDAFYLHDSLLYPPGVIDLMNPNPAGYTINWTSDSGPQSVTFKPYKYLRNIPIDPFVGAPRWIVHFASGTSTVTFQSSPIVPPADHVGVFDVSPDPNSSVRRGFVTAIDGTNYEDW